MIKGNNYQKIVCVYSCSAPIYRGFEVAYGKFYIITRIGTGKV